MRLGSPERNRAAYPLQVNPLNTGGEISKYLSIELVSRLWGIRRGGSCSDSQSKEYFYKLYFMLFINLG